MYPATSHPQTLDLFPGEPKHTLGAPREGVTDAAIDALLAANAPVAIGVSGGKDSQAVAIAVARHLDRVGHTGPKVLVHADLGRVEWNDSMLMCEDLAKQLGWELIVVRRAAGDMMDRWLGRWESSVARYEALETVRVVLPWSTPAMRFCTSELKISPISSALRKRFPTGPIVSVDGVRAQESSARAKKPISSASSKLTRSTGAGVDWHAILHWTTDDVFAEIAGAGMTPHPAYTVHGSTRVSCGFCIMGSMPDLTAATRAPEHHDLYREMVNLECRSTFAFQSTRWLGDVAPDLLGPDGRAALADAKERCLVRQRAEADIPKPLLFGRGGWPTGIPTIEEARVLATARRTVAGALGLRETFGDAESVRDRIASLYAESLGRAA